MVRCFPFASFWIASSAVVVIRSRISFLFYGSFNISSMWVHSRADGSSVFSIPGSGVVSRWKCVYLPLCMHSSPFSTISSMMMVSVSSDRVLCSWMSLYKSYWLKSADYKMSLHLFSLILAADCRCFCQSILFDSSISLYDALLCSFGEPSIFHLWNACLDLLDASPISSFPLCRTFAICITFSTSWN